MSSELIPIQQREGGQAVSAKELHLFLQVQTRFDMWVQRMFEFGFSEGQDFCTILGESTGGRPATDYALTLDCAKEISMLQRTERGQQARRYFIEIEKRHKAMAPAVPASLKDALLLAYEQQCRIEAQDAAIAQLAPKAEYVDEVLNSQSTWTTTTIAKELGVSAQRLNAELYAAGVQYLNGDGVWVLYARYAAKHYTRTRTHTYANYRGETMTRITTVWTEEGRRFVHELLNHRMKRTGGALMK